MLDSVFETVKLLYRLKAVKYFMENFKSYNVGIENEPPWKK